MSHTESEIWVFYGLMENKRGSEKWGSYVSDDDHATSIGLARLGVEYLLENKAYLNDWKNIAEKANIYFENWFVCAIIEGEVKVIGKNGHWVKLLGIFSER